MTKAQVVEQARLVMDKAKGLLQTEVCSGQITEDQYFESIFRVNTLTRQFPITGKEKSFEVLKKRQYEYAQWILEYTRDK
jgi:hypothetical protein